MKVIKRNGSNENISFDYNFKHSEIKVNSLEKKNNQKIKLDTIIELNPFYLKD